MNYICDRFQKEYATYAQRIPNFRAYVWFYGKITLNPEDLAFNKKIFTEAAGVMKGKNIFGIGLTSEPHGFAPKAYVEMLKTAR